MHIGGSVGRKWRWRRAQVLQLVQDSVVEVGRKSIAGDLVVAEPESGKNECARILTARDGAGNVARTPVRTAHQPFLISVSIIVPTEAHLLVLEGDEAMIGDGNPVGVSGEIAEHMLWVAEGWFEVNHPFLPKPRTQEGSKGLRSRCSLGRSPTGSILR
jgi:hypothetical protein